MTLLELTVVILVLLTLISILFIGARGWKEGSDRSDCILNIRNAQNAAKAYQNVHQMSEGASLNMATDLIGEGNYLQSAPECPSGGFYSYLSHIPYAGELVLACSLAGSEAHVPRDSSGW